MIVAAFCGAAWAQQPNATGGAVVASGPGNAAVVRAAELSAQVVAIDKTTRTVTLKGPQGNFVDVVAGDEVRNFDQIKLGDLVVARYVEAVTLELKKTRVKAGEATVSVAGARANSGERPAAAGAREITAIAEVVGVDPKKSTITLKGPRGKVMSLAVQNPDQFKVVRKGDQVEVTYTEALALSVEPASTAPAAKK
jgi:propanediol utilization protein